MSDYFSILQNYLRSLIALVENNLAECIAILFIAVLPTSMVLLTYRYARFMQRLREVKPELSKSEGSFFKGKLHSGNWKPAFAYGVKFRTPLPVFIKFEDAELNKRIRKYNRTVYFVFLFNLTLVSCFVYIIFRGQ